VDWFDNDEIDTSNILEISEEIPNLIPVVDLDDFLRCPWIDDV
jgi:hypothetical protein